MPSPSSLTKAFSRAVGPRFLRLFSMYLRWRALRAEANQNIASRSLVPHEYIRPLIPVIGNQIGSVTGISNAIAIIAQGWLANCAEAAAAPRHEGWLAPGEQLVGRRYRMPQKDILCAVGLHAHQIAIRSAKSQISAVRAQTGNRGCLVGISDAVRIRIHQERGGGPHVANVDMRSGRHRIVNEVGGATDEGHKASV